MSGIPSVDEIKRTPMTARQRILKRLGTNAPPMQCWDAASEALLILRERIEAKRWHYAEFDTADVCGVLDTLLTEITEGQE